MTETLYLHIGWGRCGSSSIQHFAQACSTELRARGVSYPSAEEMGLPPTRGGNGMVLKPEADLQARLDHVAAYVAKAPERACLLSSEFLCPLSAEYFRMLKRSFAAHGIRVVCVAYVREQREWLLSRYAQAVKSRRWTMSLEEYLRERSRSPNLNYAERFKMLAEVFGTDDVSAHLFQRDGLRGGDIRIDLFDLMNVDVRDLIRDEPNANASASILEIETMRAVNKVLPVQGFNNREFLRKSRNYFTLHGWQPEHELHRLVPPGLMHEIAQHYQEPNEQFRREFFPDRTAPLFATKIPDDYAVLDPGERIDGRSIELLVNYFVDLNQLRAVPAEAPPRKAARKAEAAPPVRRRWFGI